MSALAKIIVVDTNVLLSDPYALYSYPEAEVVVPQTVLSELDKLKLARGDSDVRFRGREVSRALFDLSQHGSLLGGIELDNGALVKVVQHDPQNFPETLNQKNGDDRILACAWRLKVENPEARVILMTNDLNMLLKAQALGIEVQQHEHVHRPGFWGRLLKVTRKRRIPVTWALIPIALFCFFVALWVLDVPSPLPSNQGPAISTTSFPLKEAQYLSMLKKSDPDEKILYQLGQLYLDWSDQLLHESKGSEAKEKQNLAVTALENALLVESRFPAARTSLGTAYYMLGKSETAISQFVQVINEDPDFALAYFNLGFLLHEQGDMDGAEDNFRTYLKLEPQGERSDFARERIREIGSADDTQTPRSES